MSVGGRRAKGGLLALMAVILQGLATLSLAHEVTFQLQSEAGGPVSGDFTWTVVGPAGIQRIQSSGDGHTMSLDDGDYTAILMRTGAETAQDFTFQIEGADRVVSVVLQSSPGAAQPREGIEHLVTITLSDEPDTATGATGYQWSLAHGNDVFFNKAEPTARLQVSLQRRETRVSVTRFPDYETVRFILNPAGVADEVIDVAWPDVSVGRVLPEGDKEGARVAVTLEPRVDGERVIVALSFETGIFQEGDAVWLEDGKPGALAMGFVQPGNAEVVLNLAPTDISELYLTYRRSQTLGVVGKAAVLTEGTKP